HPERPMSHDIVQKWIDEFTASMEIDNSKARLTTHCLRRGGVQHWFMFAPIGKLWTLPTIQWWRGWAEGEHVRYVHLPLQVPCN
ncbi:hypothetical protein BU17DRAFT_53367, partial [Hysterangium stoloniferum]